jgi:hypothetical protein
MDRFLSDDRTERYIMRFNLKKKDPKSDLSEPVKPIVWTLDPSIPDKYRDSVRQAILTWNKAFEAAGYRNAVQVQDPPADYDHADGRFNVVRWTVSPSTPFAVAMPRTDPITGEILNASVNFDANYLAWVLNEHAEVVTSASTVTSHPESVVLKPADPSEALNDEAIWEPDVAKARQALSKFCKKFGWRLLQCEQASGLAQSASDGYAALMLAPGLHISREDYAKAFIVETISHEIGHCLGLRHNFQGSTYLSLDELGNDSITNYRGTSASVMDYNPVNVMSVLKGRGTFYMPSVGDYDKWAIQYGYQEFPSAKSTIDERPYLAQIASLSAKPGHGYQTDEFADNWDPYAMRFDAANDAIAYNAKMLETAAREKKYAITKLPIQGESFQKRTKLVLSSLLQTVRSSRECARFIGGVHASRSFVGDPGATSPLTPVDPQKQREALNLIVSSCFQPGSFSLSRSTMLNLSYDPDSERSPRWTAPLREITNSLQERVFLELMNYGTTLRITENEYKMGNSPDTYTIHEHFDRIHQAIFQEVGQNRRIEPTRRDLQHFALAVLTLQAGAPDGSVPSDVRLAAESTIHHLSARISNQLHHSKGLDAMTLDHLEEMSHTIERFENRHDISDK